MRYVKTLVILVLIGCFNTLIANGFIENKGQWEGPFLFKKEIQLGAIYLETNTITFHLVEPLQHQHGVVTSDAHDHSIDSIYHHAFKLHFEGANPNPNIETKQKSKEYYNYLLGNDPTKWKSNIHAAGRIIYHDLYDGIDLHIIDEGDGIKYEFYVEPFADPKQINIKTEGLDGMKVDGDGQLFLQNTISDVIELKPVLYQNIRGKQRTFNADFRIEDNRILYDLPDYDSSSVLIIDPTIVFSTYSGSTSDNWGYTATPDQRGFLVSGGIVSGNGYPVTTGAFATSFQGGSWDIALTKYDTSGTYLIFSTYLGGSGMDAPHSLICDSRNNVFVYGSTSSSNFPMLPSSFDPTFNGGPNISVDQVRQYTGGSDIYIAKLSEGGDSLLGATFIGGSGSDGLNHAAILNYNYSDESRGEINLDETDFVYVASSTTSQDFPVTQNAFRTNYSGNQDAVLFKLSNDLSSLEFSTYLGGLNEDAGYAVEVASDGSVLMAGGTASASFPTTFNAFDNTYGGDIDGYITRFNSTGTAILNSTFIGTPDYDQVYLLELDDQDSPHYFGQTENTGSALIQTANYNVPGGGQIVGKLNLELSQAEWLTRFGNGAGQTNLSPTAMLVDVCNNVYLAGWGGSLNTENGQGNGPITGLTTTLDAFKSNADPAGDFYFAVLPSDASQLLFGSYYGGNQSGEHVDGGTSRFDKSGKIYQSVCAGCFSNDDFPIEPNPGAWSATNGASGCNNGVMKIDFDLPIVVADIDLIPSYGCAPFTLAFQNLSDTYINSTFQWDFGANNTTNAANPVFTFNEPGTYEVRLIITDSASCNIHDTAYTSIEIKVDTSYTIPPIEACAGVPVEIGPNPDSFNLDDRIPLWVPSNLVSNPNVLNPTVTLDQDQTFRLILDYDGCFERIDQTIIIDEYPIDAGEDTIICSSFTPFSITGTSYGQNTTFEWSTDVSFDNIIDTDSILNITSLSGAQTRFYLRTENEFGCIMYDDVLVTISDLDLQLDVDSAVCLYDTFNIYATTGNPINTFYYYWKNESFTGIPTAPFLTDTFSNNIRVSLDQDTTFYLYAASIKVPGCNVTDSIRVNVASLEPTDVVASTPADSFLITELVELNGIPGEPYNHAWDGPYLTSKTEQNTTARPKDEITEYIYTVSDPEVPACIFSDTVKVYGYTINCGEPDIFIPDAFTPNGDGTNDIYQIYGSVVETIDLHIYDRWGNEVFGTNDISEGWDGTYKDEPLKPAIFDYYLNVGCINGRQFFKEGNISLIEP